MFRSLYLLRRATSRITRQSCVSFHEHGRYRTEFDYVIVGAGSAGCVLANRLSADASKQVLLVEAGPTDWSWTIACPSALQFNLGDEMFNWAYESVPQRHMDNRVMYQPRGRVLGGSSSLNAMCYVRGHPYDYDRWQTEGATGWSYKDCLPYFRKAQTFTKTPIKPNAAGAFPDIGADEEYIGRDGPLHVTNGDFSNPLHHAFVTAGIEAGYPYHSSSNGYQQEGVGPMEMTIHNGKRCSASVAYLDPIKCKFNLSRSGISVQQGRKNLTIMDSVYADKILFNGKKAIGARLRDAYDRNMDVFAGSSTILCGGAFNSPHLLMLSGVGPKAHLQEHGIQVVHDLPGVGENLQDHLEIYVQRKCKQPVTMFLYDAPISSGVSVFTAALYRQCSIGIQWFLHAMGAPFVESAGVCGSNQLESGGFARSEPGVLHPDIQWHFLPGLVLDHGRKLGSFHAYQLHAGPMRPEARGTLRLRSADPREKVLVDYDYLSTERDRWEMRRSVLMSREIFEQPAFAPFDDGEIAPGSSVGDGPELDAFIRAHADSAYHPSCTCRMGEARQDIANEVSNRFVVDTNTKVHGMEGLHVVDASVMPSVVSANLNAPTIMLAEKAADHIIHGKAQLPQQDAKVWKPKHPEKQRDGVTASKLQ